jgi:hypothetical protein
VGTVVTERRGVAVVIRHVRHLTADADRDDVETTFYGPFLPHAGSAVDRQIETLRWEDEERADVDHSESYVETTFLADGESDAVLIARDSL